MSMEAEKYQYEPLKSPTTIRLAILPRHDGIPDDEEIYIQLIQIELSKAEKTCAALSYFWGDESDPKTIYIDGKTHKVTSNLDFFLRRKRYPERLGGNQYF